MYAHAHMHIFSLVSSLLFLLLEPLLQFKLMQQSCHRLSHCPRRTPSRSRNLPSKRLKQLTQRRRTKETTHLTPRYRSKPKSVTKHSPASLRRHASLNTRPPRQRHQTEAGVLKPEKKEKLNSSTLCRPIWALDVVDLASVCVRNI